MMRPGPSSVAQDERWVRRNNISYIGQQPASEEGSRGKSLSVAFDHGNGAALFAEAPHGSLAVKSRSTGDAKLWYLRAVRSMVNEGL